MRDYLSPTEGGKNPKGKTTRHKRKKPFHWQLVYESQLSGVSKHGASKPHIYEVHFTVAAAQKDKRPTLVHNTKHTPFRNPVSGYSKSIK